MPAIVVAVGFGIIGAELDVEPRPDAEREDAEELFYDFHVLGPGGPGTMPDRRL